MAKLRRVALVVVAALTFTGCWPYPWQNADRTSSNPLEDVLTAENASTLAIDWVAPLDGDVAGDAVSFGGAVNVHDDRSAYGIDLETGARQWARGVPAPGTVDPVLRDGGELLVPSAGGTERNVADEKTVWVDAATGAPTGEHLSERVVARRGDMALTFFTFDPRVAPEADIAIVTMRNLETQEQVWSGWGLSEGEPRPVPQPVTIGDRWLYHAGFGMVSDDLEEPGANALRAFDLVEPRRHPVVVQGITASWLVRLDGTTATPPVLDAPEDTVFTGTDAGTVYAIDVPSRTVRWTASLGSAVTGSPALAGGKLYVPTASGDLVVLAEGGCGAATCSPLWRGPTGSSITTQPAVAGGVVYTGSANGAVRGFAAAGCGGATCTPLWSTSTLNRITGGPSVFAGRVFYGTQHGNLVAYAPGS
jgi:outer membrane protein assembly factor BamB